MLTDDEGQVPDAVTGQWFTVTSRARLEFSPRDPSGAHTLLAFYSTATYRAPAFDVTVDGVVASARSTASEFSSQAFNAAPVRVPAGSDTQLAVVVGAVVLNSFTVGCTYD
jgi:hypothetical protein